MNSPQTWYIIRAENQTCEIVSSTKEPSLDKSSWWGPFNSQADAIAKRVGLIRAGKCKPL